jgi:glucose-1-phosphate cytidylyltransferase
VKVVILCGGQGTRLREETEYRPKPMVEVGGRPIVWHIMKSYAHYGHAHFVLCLGYKGNIIKDYFLNYEAMNSDITLSLGQLRAIAYHDQHQEQEFNVTLADTGQNTLTGGRLVRVKRHVGKADTFLLTYGDGLSDVNIAEVIAFHRMHGKKATLTTVRPTSRYGIIDIGAGGAVQQFNEKPVLDSWINAGFFVFQRSIFDYLDGGDDCILERKPLERLAAEGQLVAYRHEGFFYAMDTYREYQHLNDLWNRGEAPWKVWE